MEKESTKRQELSLELNFRSFLAGEGGPFFQPVPVEEMVNIASVGCPVTIPAGKLIDELGLKGTRVGGAMVSMEHGNFIVNDGTATARDVLELIALLKARALEARGIHLHTEVEIIGEE